MSPDRRPSPEQLAGSRDALRRRVPPGVDIGPRLGGWLAGPPSPSLPAVPPWRHPDTAPADVGSLRFPLRLFGSAETTVVGVREIHQDPQVALRFLAVCEQIGGLRWDATERILIETAPTSEYWRDALAQMKRR